MSTRMPLTELQDVYMEAYHAIYREVDMSGRPAYLFDEIDAETLKRLSLRLGRYDLEHLRQLLGERDIKVNKPQELFGKMTARIVDGTRERLEGVWGELGPGAQSQIEFASHAASEIALMKLAGEDTEYHETALEAIFLNWSYKHASQVARAFWDTVSEVLGAAGQFLGQIAVGALSRIAGAG